MLKLIFEKGGDVMKFSVETLGKIAAQGRNYASMLVGFIGGVGIISAAQSKGLTDSLNEIAAGVSQIIHGATSIWQILIAAFPFLAVWFAKMAGNSAKTTSQAAAVQAAVKEANGNPNTQLPLQTKAAILDAAASLPEVKPTTIKVSDPVLAVAVPAQNVVSK